MTLEQQTAGLDDESLNFVLQTLKTVAERKLDAETRLRLDAEDTFPAELMQELLGPEVGLHLLFLPEDVGGLGGGGRDLFRDPVDRPRDLLAGSALLLARGRQKARQRRCCSLGVWRIRLRSRALLADLLATPQTHEACGARG